MSYRRSTKGLLSVLVLVSLAACTWLGVPGARNAHDRALVLDGTGWVEFPDADSAFDFVPGGQRTFALWVKYARPQYHAAILDKAGGSSHGFTLFVSPYSTAVGVAYTAGVPLDATGYTVGGAAGGSIGDDVWHHLALVQRDTLVDGYLDGRLAFHADIAKTLPGMANDLPLMLGWSRGDVVRFKGEIDDISVWSRALSQREVADLMYHAPDLNDSALEAYWPMDDGTGQTVIDRSGHGHDGIGTGISRAPATRPLGPPLPDRMWFRLVVGALLLLALYGLMYLYSLRLRHQKRVLERQVAERVADLARANAEKDRALQTVASQAQRLEALDSAKRRFFADISHEFRSPLSLIIGPLSDLAERREDDWDDDLRRAVTVALRNGRRLAHLTDQLLDLARLEGGALRLDTVPLDLAQLLRELAEAFRLGAERQGVQLETDVPEAPAMVMGDRERLETIFANLLSNAVRFTPGGGTVQLTLTIGADAAHVRVADEGPGIPAGQADRIFDRFYQTPLGLEAGGGAGIGLSLVRELVQLHGGRVALMPAPGQGAVFGVWLPLHTRADAAAAAPVKPDPVPVPVAAAGEPPPDEEQAAADQSNDADGESDRSQRPLVLVAEDQADLRAFIAAQLEPDYRVVETANGATALTLARTQVPDLVISDVMMPEMDGLALLAALREDADLAGVPVILLTARSELEDRVSGLEHGADAYMVKPFEPPELVARVQNLLEQRKRLRRQMLQQTAAPSEAPAPRAGGAGEPDDLEAGLRRAVEAHMGDPRFGVNELAASVGMERTGLYRRMVDVLETTPSAFLREARLRRAAELLAEENTVAEVAYAVGYESVSSFSRVFRERFGDPPGQYARSRG